MWGLSALEQSGSELLEVDPVDSHEFVTCACASSELDMAFRNIGHPGEEVNELFIGQPVPGWRRQCDDEGPLLDAENGGCSRARLCADAESNGAVMED
jgi:hypothetical protein